ncbi:WD40-repeat-containing domain protein [Myxozyma melibiosi]|uniref:WD40-repeat-containing domain protein n=1 Tax=Myxozyma melibiosi TaxID=54550 RepID=A0ABR1F4I3_9ASCO
MSALEVESRILSKKTHGGFEEDYEEDKEEAVIAVGNEGTAGGASTALTGSVKPRPKKNTHRVKDARLRQNLRRADGKFRQAKAAVKASELLLQEEAGFLEAEGMEKTYKFTQEELKKNVDVTTASKAFDLTLDFGPYEIDYTTNGRKILLGGRKGHIASFDFREGALDAELNVNETVRDVKYLHNDQFFAVAQKKYVFIYDKTGAEVHCLKKHIEVTHMEFLKYHFLLATVGNAGWLKYQDTSTGDQVCELRTKMGPSTAMTHNAYNAIVHLGHSNGTVSLWSPNSTTPLVRMLCHKGPVQAIAVDRGGHYMASAGADGQLKIWDVRTYKEVHAYYTPTPANTLSISDRGLLAVGWGPHVTVWKDALKVKQKSPYMTHLNPGSTINDLRFCPFDDILGMGHDGGLSSLIVPGSGEPNFDALEANPYETVKQRRETEVQGLLNKLKPEMIALDPNFIGGIDARAPDERKQALKLETTSETDKIKEENKKLQVKAKTRGKNSALRRYLRKKASNVIDERRLRVQESWEKEKSMRENYRKKQRGVAVDEVEVGPALARFGK